jgi:nucleoside-diphosphate-sugar epimerase
MRIMAAGGAGYIGSVLVPLLQSNGHDVDVVDELWFGNHLPTGTTIIQRELFDLAVDDLRPYDQVIFLAGLSNDPMAEFSPAQNFVMNGALPSYLAFNAKAAGVKRFVYAASCSVYGYTVDDVYDEDGPVTCGYPYGISKLQGEHGVLQLQDNSFSTIALRQGTIGGYSPRMRFDLIVNTMFRCAMQDGRIRVDNPTIWRPLLDIRDTSAAFLSAVEADPAVNGVFNLTCGNFTVGEVADLVKREVSTLSGKKIEIDYNNVEDFRNYKVSAEKAKSVLGFQAKYGVAETVQELYRHLQEYGDFSNDNYYNIRVFKAMQLEESTVSESR